MANGEPKNKYLKSGKVFIEVDTKHQSGHETSKSKSFEDHNVAELFTSQSFTAQVSEFYKICYTVQRIEQYGR